MCFDTSHRQFLTTSRFSSKTRAIRRSDGGSLRVTLSAAMADRSASRARADAGRNRPAPAPMEGMEFRILRVYDEAVKHWREATESDKETVPNACVLLYAWKIHFEPNNAITSKNILNIDALKRHCNRFRSDAITVSAVKYFAELECFLLKHMPENEYTKYIVQVKEQIEAYDNGSFRLEDIVPAHVTDEDLEEGQVRRLRWMAPDAGTVVDWCSYLHSSPSTTTNFGGVNVAGRNNNWGTLGLKLAAISSISVLFGGPKLDRKDATLSSEIKKWMRGHFHTKKSAPSFLITELPLLHDACMNHPRKHEEVKKRTWVMMMLQLNVMGRASCITTHCPLQKEVEYPPMEDGYFTGSTLPHWIRLVWRNWKSRNIRFVDAQYPIRFHSNTIENQARFDIVYLLLDWFNYLETNGLADDDKKIFDITAATYEQHVKIVFDRAYEITGDEKWLEYSSHSIRYSGTLWARMCGADLHIVKRVGRWAALEILLQYMADGDREGTPAIVEQIKKIAVFKTVADGSRAVTEFPTEEAVAGTGNL